MESYTFSYNELGDCVSQTKTSVTPSEVTEYEYYVGGNLKQVTLPDATEVEYLYDANSNRIQKTNATEIIDYHYAGSELKSEVHKNKQNTVLYTLTYYPYGFSKTVGQTTTSYYYIYDNRGFVWALTDSGGDIVETYDYSPYGELLSTPVITNHLFLSGADQCIYDEEVSMVHLNNRYYIPKMGRFLQRDSVEGTPTSTISQNLYTYCQNSPITLIDPSGNSPQNTGTPPRVSSFDASAFSGDKSCYMPDINQPAGALASGPLIEVDIDDLPNGGRSIMLEDPESEFDACANPTRPSDAVLTGDIVGTVDCGNYTIEYGYDQYGNPIAKVTPKKGGNAATAQAMEDGINEGLFDIASDGYFCTPEGFKGDINSWINNRLTTLMTDMSSYMATNWGKITKINSDFKDPKTAFYHATRGAAIGSEMGSVSDIGLDWNSEYFKSLRDTGMTEKDLKITIGMAVSYNDKKYGTNMGLYSSTDVNGNKTLGLVQVGNLILATIKGESDFNPTAVRHNLPTPDNDYHESWDLGLMQNNVANKELGIKAGYFDPMKSIFIGVGAIFHKLKTFSPWKSNSGIAPSQEDWMSASFHYRGANEGRQGIWENMIKFSKKAPWIKKWKDQK
jgi:RHS repeat-associated protein